MTSKKVSQKPNLRTLRRLIAEYCDAAIADSWKGGGDPDSYEVIEATLKLKKALLENYLTKLEREWLS